MEGIKKYFDILYIDNDFFFLDKVKFIGWLIVILVEEIKIYVLVKIDGLEVFSEAFWMNKVEFEWYI